jgi:hypothetical protein
MNPVYLNYKDFVTANNFTTIQTTTQVAISNARDDMRLEGLPSIPPFKHAASNDSVEFFEAEDVILLVNNENWISRFYLFAPKTQTILCEDISLRNLTDQSPVEAPFTLSTVDCKQFAINTFHHFCLSNPHLGYWTSVYLPRALQGAVLGYTTALLATTDMHSESLGGFLGNEFAEIRLDAHQYAIHVKRGIFSFQMIPCPRKIYAHYNQKCSVRETAIKTGYATDLLVISGRGLSHLTNARELLKAADSEGFDILNTDEVSFTDLWRSLKSAELLISLFSIDMPNLGLAVSTCKKGVIFNSSYYFSRNQRNRDVIATLADSCEYKPLFGRQAIWTEQPEFATYTAPIEYRRYLA